MWYLILCAALMLILTWYAWAGAGPGIGDRLMLIFLLWVIAPIVFVFAGYPILCATTGLFPDYTTGQREGFITKVSVKGVIWKTNEAQIQVGTGQMAALQEPFAFSVPPELVEDVQNALGQQVVINYTGYFLMPWRYGETNYLLTSLNLITAEK